MIIIIMILIIIIKTLMIITNANRCPTQIFHLLKNNRPNIKMYLEFCKV